MIRTVFGIFLILHGLVHLLYFALSRKLFELDPPLVGWPDRSWLFSSMFSDTLIRSLASVLYLLAVILFVISGVAFLLQASWWTTLLVIAAVFSSVLPVVFWDGQFQRMPDKGFVGLLINVALLVVVFLIDRAVIAF